jgi:hypothetical protein
MTRIGRGLAALGASFFMATAAHASPTAVGEGAFSSSAIDSNVADSVAITNQLPGITASGGLFGDEQNSGRVPGGGALVTGNFAVDCSVCPPIAIDFSSSIIRFGLVIVTAPEDDTTLSLFRGGSNIGQLTYVTDLTGRFIGIEDLSGFDRVVISPEGSSSGAFVADLFRFDPAATGVPLPGTLALLVSAVVGVGGVRAWRRR